MVLKKRLQASISLESAESIVKNQNELPIK